MSFLVQLAQAETVNKLAANGTSLNGLTSNGALGDLNGVRVETVIIPDAAR